jgi:hypothetical protein
MKSPTKEHLANGRRPQQVRRAMKIEKSIRASTVVVVHMVQGAVVGRGRVCRCTPRGLHHIFALPALALAFLGLRVMKLERMERAQQVRDQQAQLARLADSTLTNMLGALQGELVRVEASPAALRDYTVLLETSGRLVFLHDKTYFPDPGSPTTGSGQNGPRRSNNDRAGAGR